MSAELPLVRQWTLLRSLCSRGCWLTVRELAEESRRRKRRSVDVSRAVKQIAFPTSVVNTSAG